MLCRKCICAAFALALTSLAYADTWTLGCWNIEDLGPNSGRGFPEAAGIPPRTDAQLKDIGVYIRDDLGADALMLSEIVHTHSSGGLPRNSQLDTIVDELESGGSDWDYFIGSSGSKSVAFLFNKGRIAVKKIAEFAVDKFTIQDQDIFLRDPLVVWIDVLDNAGDPVDDLLLVGLHLKSQQKFRDNHLVAMAKLVTELAKFKKDNGINKSEDDIIIFGDLNDSAHTRARFQYLFAYMKDKRYTHLRNDNGDYPDTRINGSEIDHIFVRRHLTNDDWIDPDSFKVHTVPQNERDAYRQTFSDHFPLTFEFEF